MMSCMSHRFSFSALMKATLSVWATDRFTHSISLNTGYMTAERIMETIEVVSASSLPLSSSLKSQLLRETTSWNWSWIIDLCQHLTLPSTVLLGYWGTDFPFHIWSALPIWSSLRGHSGCFHVFAFVNNAALSIGVHVSSPDICPREGLLDCMVVLVLVS